MSEFVHLHVHSHYSLLDGAAKISELVKKAKDLGMPAIALTDHGNLYGAFEMHEAASNEGIKPILGAEFYIAKKSRKDHDNRGYHLILLAKNLTGYHNICILSTLAFKEGIYYVPRIDKELLQEYHEGIIASSACLGGEIAKTILQNGIDEAEKVVWEYKEIFGEDFYLELMRHGIPEQETVNSALGILSKRCDVPLIATNDVHFINKSDFEAHKILIKLNTDPKNLETDTNLVYTGNEYLRSPDEMAEIFKDFPEAIENTVSLAEKVEKYKLKRSILLPRFPLPEEFTDENEYLRYLTFEGSQRKYPEMTDEIKQRLDYELEVIKNMGFSGYFLIVQDFINAARRMDVIVGPGRGSATGSAVAYAIGITNIDPIRYNLLFERFLNPERISMPDIDVDFDDEGRQNVLNYVAEKYGEDHVAQIITFGSMAAKSAIRDVARVIGLPLSEADRLAKLIPDRLGIKLQEAIEEVPELEQAAKGSDEKIQKVIEYARILEGSVRQTGTHACGVIIGPDDLKKYIPMATQKDSQLLVTQFEGKSMESVGMLKMDFLGLKTLSIIREALHNIKLNRSITIDIDNIPLDDPLTFQLYQKGDTIGTFQFESEGMRMYLRELKPEHIEDLIAMNALYRPGPMQYIPMYINRKKGREKVTYPHDMLRNILEDTQGIMIYQEQIMQVAQKMGGFSLGSADILRRAMGKKDPVVMAQQKEIFIQGALNKGVTVETASEVFETMLKFAQYGFNRSHSTAYSILAYQTAYLKANFPAEYMAAVLTHNLNDIKKITYYIDECQRMGINVLGPDVNESQLNFFVNKKNEIRFGLTAIKNVGENAANSIIKERENGLYTSLEDFIFRLNLKAINKRTLESLIMAGALDGFQNIHRAQFFHKSREDEPAFIEKLLRHASLFQARKQSSQMSLFGEFEEFALPKIELPACEPWDQLTRLHYEKEVTGFYISGHPLDLFKLEIDNLCTHSIKDFKNDLEAHAGKEIIFAAMVSEAKERYGKNNKIYCSIVLEDFDETYSVTLFSEQYLKYKHLLTPGSNILIRATAKQRFNGSSYELGINQIGLLSDALDNWVEKTQVFIPLPIMDDHLIQQLDQSIRENPGTSTVSFTVFDPADQLSLNFENDNLLINTSGFARELKKIDGIFFKFFKKKYWSDSL